MGNNKFKVLVVEDEANIRSMMKTLLETAGYQVLLAKTCSEGEMMLVSYLPDLVILDLGLPDKDGLEFIRKARKTVSTPIIVLSARTTEEDKVFALDEGANDYVTKPFGTAELLARVRSALRNARSGEDIAVGPDRTFCVGDLTIQYARREVRIGERNIHLTQTEYNIVALLSEHAGKVLTYSAIIKAIWGGADPGGVKKLQVNMANIRKKLGEKPGGPRYISNELGVGYRMMDEI